MVSRIKQLEDQIEGITTRHREEIRNLKEAQKATISALKDQVKWLREDVTSARKEEEVYDISHLAEDDSGPTPIPAQEFTTRANSWIEGVVPREEKIPEEELDQNAPPR